MTISMTSTDLPLGCYEDLHLCDNWNACVLTPNRASMMMIQKHHRWRLHPLASILRIWREKRTMRYFQELGTE
jgi:hypothetical protein